MPSQTETLVREVLAWVVGEDPPGSSEKIDAWVTEFLIYRATTAMNEGVRRYVPVDGHDWHENAGGVEEGEAISETS